MYMYVCTHDFACMDCWSIVIRRMNTDEANKTRWMYYNVHTYIPYPYAIPWGEIHRDPHKVARVYDRRALHPGSHNSFPMTSSRSNTSLEMMCVDEHQRRTRKVSRCSLYKDHSRVSLTHEVSCSDLDTLTLRTYVYSLSMFSMVEHPPCHCSLWLPIDCITIYRDTVLIPSMQSTVTIWIYDIRIQRGK